MNMTNIEIFNPDELAWKAQELHEKYVSAAPFPHIAIDNFLSAEVYSMLSKEYPDVDAPIWYEFKSGAETKSYKAIIFMQYPKI